MEALAGVVIALAYILATQYAVGGVDAIMGQRRASKAEEWLSWLGRTCRCCSIPKTVWRRLRNVRVWREGKRQAREDR